MKVTIDPHALLRMTQRGATRPEVEHTVRHGARSPAKFGRTCFEHRFTYHRKWNDRPYSHKMILAYAVETSKDEWLVVTVVVKFFNRRSRP